LTCAPYTLILQVYQLPIILDDSINDEENVTHLADALRGNRKVSTIIIPRRDDYSTHHVKIIFDALSQCKVEYIDMQSPFINTVMQHIHMHTLPHLTDLILTNSNIGSSEVISLAAILSNNVKLRRLYLDHNNRIGDTGAIALGNILKTKNHTLTDVRLDNIGITEHGQMALRNAIYDDSSFGSIRDSNHVLESYFHRPHLVFEQPMLNDVMYSLFANSSAKAQYTKKDKGTLFYLRSNVYYGVKLQYKKFLDTDVNVLPYIMGWISERCDLDTIYSFKLVTLNMILYGK